MDDELLEGVFESSRVGLGLLAFHSAFLHYIARPPGVALDKVIATPSKSDSSLEKLQLLFTKARSVCFIGSECTASQQRIFTNPTVTHDLPDRLVFLQVMEQSDVLFGRPSEGQVKRMQAAISRIQAICNWEQQLQVLGVQPEGNPDLQVFMTKVLRRAWQRSLQKGYHSKASHFLL